MSEIQKTALRLPKDLHAKVIRAAKDNNRTMNAEIVERLETSFNPDLLITEIFPTASDDIVQLAEKEGVEPLEMVRNLLYSGLSEHLDDKPSRRDLADQILELQFANSNLKTQLKLAGMTDVQLTLAKNKEKELNNKLVEQNKQLAIVESKNNDLSDEIAYLRRENRKLFAENSAHHVTIDLLNEKIDGFERQLASTNPLESELLSRLDKLEELIKSQNK